MEEAGQLSTSRRSWLYASCDTTQRSKQKKHIRWRLAASAADVRDTERSSYPPKLVGVREEARGNVRFCFWKEIM